MICRVPTLLGRRQQWERTTLMEKRSWKKGMFTLLQIASSHSNYKLTHLLPSYYS